MMNVLRRSPLWLGLGILVVLLVATAATFAHPYSFHGSVIQDTYPAPDFRLIDNQGRQFQLTQQHGKVVLIFFGFTNCSDICPTTMADFKQISQRLGKDAGKVDFVFITVDPDRDTPQITAQYVAQFDPAFYGLSGTEQELKPVWEGYGVYRKLNRQNPADTSYEVEHSTQIYAIDPSGNLRLTFSYGTSIDNMLQDVRYLISKGS
jgi:protein SCO1